MTSAASKASARSASATSVYGVAPVTFAIAWAASGTTSMTAVISVRRAARPMASRCHLAMAPHPTMPSRTRCSWATTADGNRWTEPTPTGDSAERPDGIAAIPVLGRLTDHRRHPFGGLVELHHLDDGAREPARVDIGELGDASPASVVYHRPPRSRRGGDGGVEVLAPERHVVEADPAAVGEFLVDARGLVFLLDELDLQLARVGERDRDDRSRGPTSIHAVHLGEGPQHDPRPDPQGQPLLDRSLKVRDQVGVLPDRTRKNRGARAHAPASNALDSDIVTGPWSRSRPRSDASGPELLATLTPVVIG